MMTSSSVFKDSVTRGLTSFRNCRLDFAESEKLAESLNKALEEAIVDVSQVHFDASIGFDPGEGGIKNC